VELLGQRAELDPQRARYLFVTLIHVSYGLSLKLLEDYIDRFAFDHMLEGLEQAESLEGGRRFFEAARNFSLRAARLAA
jgi:hypothetical protein